MISHFGKTKRKIVRSSSSSGCGSREISDSDIKIRMSIQARLTKAKTKNSGYSRGCVAGYHGPSVSETTSFFASSLKPRQMATTTFQSNYTCRLPRLASRGLLYLPPKRPTRRPGLTSCTFNCSENNKSKFLSTRLLQQVHGSSPGGSRGW